MNVLMINPTHPSTPHISAVRAWRFAQELVALGHRVVLLTATDASGKATQAVVDARHDWRQPLVVACADATPPCASWPTLVRRVLTVLRMLRHGGGARAWLRAAVVTGAQLPTTCRPDVVWCTFGHMEAVFVARRIARQLRCPWVLDFKDNWELFVPRGLRRLMAWRTRGFAAATANAELTRAKAKKWHGVDAALIYSGVETCFLAPASSPHPSNFEINLVGAVYFPDLLSTFLTGVTAWYQHLTADQRLKVRLRYIGAQDTLVRAAVEDVLPGLPIELPGYVSATEMAQLCQSACVNAYITHAGGFHHKLPELLACGRAVLAYPSESKESVALASAAPGQLTVAATPSEVTHILTAMSTAFFEHGLPPAAFSSAQVARLSWSAQARSLQQVLAAAIVPR